jgi:hypothetical protein
MNLSALTNNQHAIANIILCITTLASSIYYKSKLSGTDDSKKTILTGVLLIIMSAIFVFLLNTKEHRGNKMTVLLMINMCVAIFLIANLYKPSCKSDEKSTQKSILSDQEVYLVGFASLMAILSFIVPLYSDKINDVTSSSIRNIGDKFKKFKNKISPYSSTSS